MAASAEKIKELLGNGLTNEVVATAVGVHPSYISQLMSDENFYADVVAKRTQTLTAATSRDRSWDSVEDKLLKKLDETVDHGMIYKPMDILRAIAVVNNAKRRGTTPTEAGVSNTVVVNLNLPTAVVHAYKKNSNSEVVEVIDQQGNSQTLVTMPAASLLKQLAETSSTNGKAYDEVRRYLPRSSEEENTAR